MAKSFIIVGDSHVRTFRWAFEMGYIAVPCSFLEVGGATAVGLRNPNSQTNAIALFLEGLIPAQEKCVPVLQLGEVDCGFLIWWRAAKYAESIEAQLDASIAAYFDFIDQLVACGYRHIVITGATLPTIKDGQDWGAVANARRDVSTSLVERTALTLRYNQELKNGTAGRGLSWVDISNDLLNNETGTIADCFRNDDAADHHLNPATAGRLWAEKLNRLVLDD